MKVFRIPFAILMAALSLSAYERTPIIQNLRPSYIYASASSSHWYLEFNTDQMTGCYSNRGGYLSNAGPTGKEIFAQLFMAMSTGGIKGRVLYTKVNPNQGQWGDCNIEGFEFYPD